MPTLTRPPIQQSSNPIQVNFKARRRVLKHIGRGVYTYPGETGKFYERPYVNGVQTTRKLNSTAKRAAEDEVARNRCDHGLSKRGQAVDPYKRKTDRVNAIADAYLAAGCPKRKASPRTAQTLREEITRVKHLKEWWGNKIVATIDLQHCQEYGEWRMSRIIKGSPDVVVDGVHIPQRGARQVEKELVTLSNIFRWAKLNSRSTGIKENPVDRDRPKFRIAEHVKHCRDFQPANADELNALAHYLFSSVRSEVLGWMLLLQAMIGHRAHEIIKLRWDAKTEEEPGYIADGKLFLYRSKTSKGTYHYIEIHPALGEVLEAMKAWRAKRYPQRPPPAMPRPRSGLPVRHEHWFLPSPEDPTKHIDPSSLTHALTRITPAMNLPPRTSHGLRSYYVNVLRSRGKPDAEIALLIGQKSGGSLIVNVYGETKSYKIGWKPTDTPAWHQWLPAGKLIAAHEQLQLL